jgi:hypothetical protein
MSGGTMAGMPSKRQRCYATGLLFLLLLQCMDVYPFSFSKEWSRRDVLQITSSAAAVLGSAAPFISPLAAAAKEESDNAVAPAAATAPYLMNEYYALEPTTAASYGRFFFPTLTPPFANRATYRYELGRDSWALEQLLTFANVTATIRTNVIRLQDGGLWVHSPQWPTGEFCHLLDELGPVRHVVLPCNAFEHKAPVVAFCKKYPDASVWISPGQYGPFGTCGLDTTDCNMGYKVDGVLTNGQKPPWLDELDFSTFYVNPPGNAGPVSEVAFFHRSSKTLVATDAVAFIPDGPAPNIFTTYFDDVVVADPTFWPRTVLQSVFLPLRTASRSANTNIPAGSSAETLDMDLDLYYPGFDAIRNRLIRAPILRGFTDARAPVETRAWIDTITSTASTTSTSSNDKSWKYDRIITCHFASPIAATPAMVRNTFSFLLEEESKNVRSEPPIACQDWELLNTLNDVISKNKLGAPASFDYTRGCLEE